MRRDGQDVSLRSMGIQVQNKDNFPVYYPMRDLNGNASSTNWPFYYSDRTLTNGQYCNGFMSRTITEENPGHEKDAVKQKMIEHEAVFKNQVSELHRLYRIQRDMMEEAKRCDINKHWMHVEPSSSSSILGSQMPSEYARKWQTACFPFANSSYARPAASSTEIVNSPLSSTKGNDIQSGRIPLQNGCSSKHCEVLDSRPSKVCKKLFDLELPAYKYIDVEEMEHLHGANDCRKDALTSNLCIRSGNKLADLNEPVQLEEATTQSPVNFLSHRTNHTEAKSSSGTGKSNPFLASSREGVWNCHYGNSNGFLSNLSAESQGKQRELLLYTYEAGHIKKNQSQALEGLEQNKVHMLCHPAEGIQGRAQQHPRIYPTHGIRGDMWRAKTGCGLPTFEKNHEDSNNSCVEPLATSMFSTSHTLANSSQFTNSWSHSVSAWGKSTNSATQKVASFHKNPCLNSSTSLEMRLSENTHASIGDNINGSSREVNPGLSSDVPLRNGFDHGYSRLRDQSTCLPSNFLNNMKNNRGDYMSSECSANHWHEKFPVSSNFIDSKSTKGLDLNEAIGREDEELVDNKDKLGESASILCWLKDKPVCKNMGRMPNSDFGFIQSSPNPPFCQSNNSKHANEAFSQNITFSERNMEAKEVGETPCAKKILGVPILEIPFASKHESSSHISTSATICSSAEGELLRNEKVMIDINVACDLSIAESDEMAVPELLFAGKGLDSEPAGMRNHFDLNSCITEEDDALGPSVASDNVKPRAILEIDLEAPVVLDSEEDNPPIQEKNQHETSLQLPEHETKKAEDEVTWIAAETIVVMSSGQCIPTENTCDNLSEDPSAETLSWFVDVVSSFADELKLNSGKENRGKGGVLNDQHFCNEEIDYFEVMTLQLTETKEEEYMPKPYVLEAQNMEDTGDHSAPTRTRRGHARRGRQRRDFQRDILPSLTSLSRHEVSEDFQTFGRLMSPQTCGFTRRNGSRNLGARGRRRTVVFETEPAVVSNPVPTSLLQQLNKGGLEDKSLTGWGKRTRRPRRQRCPPAANPPIATVT